MIEPPLADPTASRQSSEASTTGDLWVALAIAAVGMALLAGIPAIGLGAGYDRIGPRFFPYLVAMGSVFIGAWIFVSTIRHRRAAGRPTGRIEAIAATGSAGWGPLAYLGLAFLVAVAFLERAGFVISAGLQFWLVARAFRSRRPARDVVVAACLSLAVYLLFSRGLGLRLPAGALF